MGKGEFNYASLAVQELPWEDIKKHNTKTDAWIVIDGSIYDISNWAKKHPGGRKIISNYAGEDATEAWCAFHTDKNYASKFLKSILVGKVKDYDTPSSTSTLLADFHEVRKTAVNMGLFKPNHLFYVLTFLHILAFDLLGWLIQAGWAQHDYGHVSVFQSNRLNHLVQLILINTIKGASAHWWNYRHNNHHAKPNVLAKDPDVKFIPLFLLGKTLPVKWGRAKKKVLPYNRQHQYFFMIMPPLLLPLYFNYEIPYYLITRRLWSEMLWLSTFFIRWYIMFGSMLGFFGTLGLFFFVRFLESHWFVWVTQMNHIPMEVDFEQEDDWVTMQVKSTCNVDQSAFNDWFSGHLNFQIEHQLV
ncbi:hypothetical protein LSH36_51g03067 [Paralvinella palmiformis]|uniref:Cytochrome b5 heme-binding domain-containing protein n=1 Tax=Paralvinella palmiformis TaxID=53620 RepID=A0AAD9K7C6_9ANNE|nr:hypothetical protein LSH36_51g03067 [Paralvinella palmiformis]